MNIHYRVLGLVAGVCEWCSRRKLYFFRIDWILFLVFPIAITGVIHEARYSLRNGSSPLEVDAADLVGASERQAELEGAFVVAAGTLVMMPVLEETVGRSSATSKVRHTYLPLVSPELGRAILVKRQGGIEATGETLPTTIRGRFSRLGSDASVDLVGLPKVISEPIDRSFMLEEGHVPAGRVSLAIQFAVWTIIGLAVLVAALRRYVIFQPTNTDCEDARTKPPSAVVALRVSGRLAVGSETGHFVGLQSSIERLDARGLCVARVVTSDDRSGLQAVLCLAPLAPGDIAQLEIGYQYFGLTRRPAVRVWTDVHGKRGRIVLNCRSESERVRLLMDLFSDSVAYPSMELASTAGLGSPGSD